MPSLKDVVERMSTETNNSTLGWDVVVNYSCVSSMARLYCSDVQSLTQGRGAERVAQRLVSQRRGTSCQDLRPVSYSRLHGLDLHSHRC